MANCTANGTRLWLLPAAMLLICAFAGESHARPQLFVPDPIGGYAIGGHDPVAYFVDGKPRQGNHKYELKWGGAEWVFVNQGNMEAFKRAPDTYAPLYAGCGGYALAEGYATAGNPFIFALVDGKLIFFHSVVNRFLFMVNGKQLMVDADRNSEKTGCKPAH
jgi:YHS domain-containing protein